MSTILDIKLIRTDTTLDLSQRLRRYVLHEFFVAFCEVVKERELLGAKTIRKVPEFSLGRAGWNSRFSKCLAFLEFLVFQKNWFPPSS